MAPASDPSLLHDPTPDEPVASTGDATLRGVLAVASLAAAAIHFAFSPVHFSQEWSHGLFFAVVGWLQLAWAVGIVVRPRRWLLWGGVANVFVVVIWALSRTVGIPLVPDGDVIEQVGYSDVLATGLEAMLILGSGWLLLRRTSEATFSARWRPTFGAVAAAVAAAVAVTTGFTPAFAGEHDHGATAAAGAAAHTTHATATSATPAAAKTPCELAGKPASPAQVTDSQGHFHRGLTPQQPIDAATRDALAAQQQQARQVADKYPTVADAVADGYRMSTPFVPCIGAHYTKISLVPRFDPSAPSELLYDGTNPDSKIVGLSYLVLHPGGAPDGFAGPNDHWHQHNANGGLCFGRSGVVIGGEDMTREQCTAIGGSKRELTDIWMLHDWVVPGWECTWGTFASECPELGGRTGGTAWDAPNPNAILPAG